MFLLAHDATVAADGTAATTTGAPPYLLRCDTCSAVATDDPDTTAPGDGFRFSATNLADLPDDDRELLEVLGWRITVQDSVWSESLQSAEAAASPRSTVVCRRCAHTAGVYQLEDRVEAIACDLSAAELVGRETEAANKTLKQDNDKLRGQVRLAVGIALCLALGALALTVVLIAVAWATEAGAA
jgi:hypothetical protein